MKTIELFYKCEERLQDHSTPNALSKLKENEVFVFGSKPDGHHDSGYPKTALERFGAIDGKAEGMAGNSYAIPIHLKKPEVMANAVSRFIVHAQSHPNIIFYVFPMGDSNEEIDSTVIATMFKDAIELDNVYLPEKYIKAIKRSIVIPKDEPLPIKYVDEEFSMANLQGRLFGLFAEISKRTSQPITLEDDILKKKDFMVYAYIRVLTVATEEENRVIQPFFDEMKRIKEYSSSKESDSGLMQTLDFVIGWKSAIEDVFDQGGSMYDLLYFTKPHLIEQSETKDDKIKVFISYSWDNNEHIKWVEKFATDLNRFFHVILDKWDLELGYPLAHFMTSSINNSDKVICVLTPSYKQKSDKLQKGVGFEHSIISAGILENGLTTKYIPVLRSGTWKESCPDTLKGRNGIEMTNDEEYKTKLDSLVESIHKRKL